MPGPDKKEPLYKGLLSVPFNAAARTRDRIAYWYLAGSSIVTAYTRLVRDDVRISPWRIFYHMPLFVVVAAPIPLPLSNILPVFLFRSLMRLRLNNWMTLADIRFKHAAHPEVLRTEFAKAMTYDPQNDRYRLHPVKATAEMARHSYRDMKETAGIVGRAAWNGVCRPFRS